MSSGEPAPRSGGRMGNRRLDAVTDPVGVLLRLARSVRGESRPSYYHIDRIAPWLLVGPALRPEDYDQLADRGVTHVLDLRAESAGGRAMLAELGIEYRRVPVPNEHPPSDQQLDEVLTWLQEEVLGGTGTLYVHCQGGIGRAPSCSMALLVSHGYSLGEAHRLVRAARPEASPSEAQMAWLEHIERRTRMAAPQLPPERETR